MKIQLALEELAQFGFAIFLFTQLDYAWWVFLALLLTPDIGMLGYIINTRIGSITYNIFHHKGIAIAIYLLGIWLQNPDLQLIGVILFGHSAMDRMLGYGLKYPDSFKHTHLGWLPEGKRSEP
jgi:multisubunit Na+/H+ antiporter MnhB subunit